MRYYFLILGTLCIAYYFVLAFYSRRLRSTFAAFWLLSGGVHLILGCAPFPVSAYTVLKWICIVLWIFFGGIEFCVIRAMFSKPKKEADWLIVLGAQVRGKRITNSLQRRLDKAVEYLKQNTATKVVVSGGQGPGEEISEAEAMAEYLIQQGIDPIKICKEDQSTSTWENFVMSGKYIDKQEETVGIVSNDFHIYRALLIAKKSGYRSIFAVPASTNPVFQLNYLVREFFAVLALSVDVKKKREV